MPNGLAHPCAAMFTTAPYSPGEAFGPASMRETLNLDQRPAPNGASEVAEAARAQPPDPRFPGACLGTFPGPGRAPFARWSPDQSSRRAS